MIILYSHLYILRNPIKFYETNNPLQIFFLYNKYKKLNGYNTFSMIFPKETNIPYNFQHFYSHMGEKVIFL